MNETDEKNINTTDAIKRDSQGAPPLERGAGQSPAVLNALSMSYEEWRAWVTEVLGEPRFRADQICQWVYGKKVFGSREMTNLSKELRDKIFSGACGAFVGIPIQIKESKSKDGTRKFLWQMDDACRVESVLLDHAAHTTACVSSQAGCPLACVFCATGRGGFSRDLTVGEIVGQFLAMEQRLGRNVNNVVFMGMGEPLLNAANVFKSIRVLNHPKMRNLGGRHITVSTAGVVPGIRDLADFEVPVRLSVSLHAPNDAMRSKLMPINKKYPLSALTDAMRYYQKRTGERVTIEYALIDGINDDPSLAFEMAALLDGMGVYVNVIPYNPIGAQGSAKEMKRPPESKIKAFCAALTELSIEYEVRREKGTDIMAACGQLAGATA